MPLSGFSSRAGWTITFDWHRSITSCEAQGAALSDQVAMDHLVSGCLPPPLLLLPGKRHLSGKEHSLLKGLSLSMIPLLSPHKLMCFQKALNLYVYYKIISAWNLIHRNITTDGSH